MKDVFEISADNLSPVILKGFKNLFFRHVMGFLIHFTGSLILARKLGPEIMGLYFISYTVFMVLRGVIDFGLQTHFIRLQNAPSHEEVSVAFTFQLIIAIVCVILIFLISPLISNWYNQKSLIILIISAGVGAFFYIFNSIPVSFLERKLEYNKVGVIEVGEFLVFNLVAVIFVFCGMGILGLVLGNILRGIFPSVLAMIYTGFVPKISTDKKIFKDLFKQVSQIFYMNITVYAIMLAPVVLLAKLYSVGEYGLAQMAYTFLGYTMVIPSIFKRIGLTVLARVQDEEEKFNKLTYNFILLLSAGYVPLVMAVSAFSSIWIPFVYGQKWAGMDKVLMLASIPVCAGALFSILHSALLSKGQYGIVLKQNILHLVVYWMALMFLAEIGASSVPITHIISMMAASYLFIYGYNKYCGKIKYGHITILFVVSTIILVLSFILIKNNQIIASIILWVVFLVYLINDIISSCISFFKDI
ncbi:MAG: oligosaccharide flippase family protein [Candidatus Firestonebacteria bacterium]